METIATYQGRWVTLIAVCTALAACNSAHDAVTPADNDGGSAANDGAPATSSPAGDADATVGADDGGASACTYSPQSVSFTWSHEQDGVAEVFEYVPPSPTGVIVELHGTGGSASSIANVKVEYAAFNAQVSAQGFALIVTESQDRVNKQWSNILDPSANVDLKRIDGLIEGLVSGAAIGASTPIYLVGMSQGGGVAPLYASMLIAQGRPVKAISVHCAFDDKVYGDAMYTTPVTFDLMTADTILPAGTPAAAQAAVVALNARGVDAQSYTKPVEKMCVGRLMRIPGIGASDAQAIFDALVAGGSLSQDGTVHITDDDRGPAIVMGLPAEYASYQQAIADQMEVVSAQHSFDGASERTTLALAFFAKHR